MQNVETIGAVHTHTHTHTHTPYIYTNAYKIENKAQKNNFGNRVVLVSVSEKAKIFKNIIKINKNSLLYYRTRDETCFVM